MQRNCKAHGGTVGWDVKWCSSCGNSRECPPQIKIELSSSPHPGIYSKELETGSGKGICTFVLTAALFTKPKGWKHQMPINR